MILEHSKPVNSNVDTATLSKNNSKNENMKTCENCAIIRGYSFYGCCNRCDKNYSNWIPIESKKKPLSMRALSWKQPFGTLMLHGKIETRKWKTNYRGPVLICISKKSYSLDELHDLCGEYVVHIIIGTLGYEPAQFDDVCGYAIAVGNLVDCRKMTPEDEDDCFIKYNPDLWCHFYENVRDWLLELKTTKAVDTISKCL